MNTVPKRSNAALVGLILSCLGLCLPPLAIVGLILGIVALVRTGRDPSVGGKGLAVAATVVGGVVLLVAVVEVAVAVPAFVRYMRKSKATEATIGLTQIRIGLESYRAEMGRYPASIARTPPVPSCDPAPWPGGQAWDQIRFSPSPGRFAYELETGPDGLSYTARAIGDLDCDGVTSTFELTSSAGTVQEPADLE